jgi:ribosome-binding factor A
MSDGRRGKRVAEDIRMHLSQILGGEVADPRLTNLVITTVKLSADLGLADVSVRTITASAQPGEAEQVAVERALTSAAGRLRHLLGARLNLKRNPTLRFHYDTAPEARERIDELLSEIAKEDRERGGSNE